VLSAFISASALIIASEQIKYLLGVSFPRQAQFYGTVYQLLRNMDDTHLLTMEVGLVALVLLFICRRLKKRLPYLEGPVLLVALGTLCAWLFDWEKRGIKLVGSIPSGFPSPLLPIPAAPAFPIGISLSLILRAQSTHIVIIICLVLTWGDAVTRRTTCAFIQRRATTWWGRYSSTTITTPWSCSRWRSRSP
jgi:MFS superfamily sulfate permease-like transporter